MRAIAVVGVAGVIALVSCSSSDDDGSHCDVSEAGAAGAKDEPSSAGAAGAAVGEGGASGSNVGGSGAAGGDLNASAGARAEEAGGGGGGAGGLAAGGAGGEAGAEALELTPLTTPHAAAGALHAAMLVDTDVQLLSSSVTHGAELAALSSLKRAADANALPEVGSPLPDSLEIDCAGGGSYVITWLDAPGATEAVELLTEFHDCERPPLGSFTARDDGPISVILEPADGAWRVLSVRFGDDEDDYTSESLWTSTGDVVNESTSSYQVSGLFMQNEELAGSFDYFVDGWRTERIYYTRAGDPTNTRYSDALTSTWARVRVGGAREPGVDDTALGLRYHSGSLTRLKETPESTTSLSFAFHDLRLEYLTRNSEGNESFQIDGAVTVTYPVGADEGCTSGTFAYQTTTPLLDGDTYHGQGSFPQFSQGGLRLNGVAVVTFLRKQELTIALGTDASVSYRDGVSAKSELERRLECFVEF